MQTMLRCLGLMIALFASLGPASAMDQSAIEETNCLMACDANQEHCATTPHAATPKNYSQVRFSSPAHVKSSAAMRSQKAIAGR